MSLAMAPLRATKVAAVGGRKRFSEPRAFNASAALNIKFNPDWSEGLTPGVTALAATVEVDATDIILEVDAASDRSVTFAAKSVQALIDEINAAQSDGTSRWRAGLGDVRPGEVTVPVVAGAAAAMLGYVDSLVLVAALTKIHVAAGTDRSNRGEGYFLPDGFNTLYDYPLDPGANSSEIGRSGGIDASQGEDVLPSRRSAFRKSPAQLAQERYPSASRFLTVVDRIANNGLVTTGTTLTYTILDSEGNELWSTIALEAVTDIPVPNVTAKGPAFLTVVGNTGAAFTAGTVAMYGDHRVA